LSQRFGVMVRTGAGTYLTVEFDEEGSAHAFRERLSRHERVRAEIRTAADAREFVELSLPRSYNGVQPIVRLH
jgi:5-formaminoimidazole-4-carboxamide-1-beta-D-ribofuranosyl 5'-monophosphate synthetase